MPKRRTSSKDMVKIHADALVDFAPTRKLSSAQMVHFERVISGKSTSEWESGIELVHATNLAIVLAQIDEESDMVEVEGTVLENNRGTPVLNPRFTALNQLTKRALDLSRVMGLQYSAATDYSAKGVADVRAKEKEARKGNVTKLSGLA